MEKVVEQRPHNDRLHLPLQTPAAAAADASHRPPCRGEEEEMKTERKEEWKEKIIKR